MATLTGLLLLAGPLPAAALLAAATGLLLLLAGLLPAAALLTALTGLLLLLAGLLPAALLTALLAALVLLATLVRIIHLAHRSVGVPPDDKHTWSAKFRPGIRDGAIASDSRHAELTRLTSKTGTTTRKPPPKHCALDIRQSAIEHSAEDIERAGCARASAELRAAWHGERFNGEVARLATYGSS